MSKEEKKERQGLPPWAQRTIKVLRALLIPVLSIAAVLAGLITGYVYIGGQQLSDVFQWETWKHVYDLVFAE